MNRMRILATGTIMLFALAAGAQQNPAVITTSDGVPTVDAQMSLLTRGLDLTADQQVQLRPILQDLRDGTEKIVHQDGLSQQQREDQVMPLRLDADKRIRVFLTADQQSKLDQVEHEPHPELHGTWEAATGDLPPSH